MEAIRENNKVRIERDKENVIVMLCGCGKSTLLKHLIGLLIPAKGQVFYGEDSLTEAPVEVRKNILRRIGVLYQGSALWSSMNLAENIALPLEEFTDLSPGDIQEIVSLKLSLVGLQGFETFLPSEISGGMRKRAGLARAMALDPEILFFDEPSAGLDPINSKRLDDLILELSDSLGTTIVIVTHELASIFAVGSNSVFLDAESKTMIASGNPRHILDTNRDPRVRKFLTRGKDS